MIPLLNWRVECNRHIEPLHDIVICYLSNIFEKYHAILANKKEKGRKRQKEYDKNS